MSEALRILCIEDNPMNWRLVQRLLSQAGYEMHWAEEGMQGYEMAVKLRPALILLDINLPGLSGFEIATKLRQNKELDGSIVVALTAKTMRSDRETALVTGCDGFISKPIDPFHFVEQVQSYLQGRRDRLEQGREGAVLRQFSQQVVEHVEGQLKEAQEINRKLLEAQGALEQRNRHLSRLLSLSQTIVAERDPKAILKKVLTQIQEDLGLQHLAAFRMHESRGYLQGLKLAGGAFQDLPVLSSTHAVVGRLEAAKGGSSALAGEALRRSPLWDQGMDLGLWPHASEAGLLPLWNRTGDGGLWGFLAFARESAKPFQAAESELLALYSGIVQVSLENAELIQHLGETSRALAESYERVESAYLELQKAQRALAGQERRALVGDLFLKMAQRLQAPVAILHKEGAELDRLSAQVPEPLAEPAQRSLNQMRSAVARVDGLVRALLRRAGQDEPSTPEWIHLHDLLVQELELMQAEGHLPQDAGVQLQLEAANPMIFGVYSDFAEVFVHLLQNAELGARGDGRLAIRTTGDAAHFRLEVEDHGPCILEADIAQAFQPFSGLREGSHGERLPGAGLPASQQLMAAYGGKLDVQSEPGRTVVGLSLPLEG